MVSMSRLTLDKTITHTIDFNRIANLRLGFIALGSTQLCSALILVCVLIFSLPMSTTQVVISGLTGVALIFFPNITGDPSWFMQEIAMWCVVPIGGILLAHGFHTIIQKNIFDHPEARRRITILIPYQMLITTYFMVIVALMKNLRLDSNSQSAYEFLGNIYSVPVVIIILIFYPPIMLPIFRFYLLRKARGLTRVDSKKKMIKKNEKGETVIEKVPSYYGTDLFNALKMWSN